MKLHALNERITEYGFPLEIEDDSKDFHGHSRGILFAMTNASGEVTENYMPENEKFNDPNEAFRSFVNDPGFTILHQQFFYNKDGKPEMTIGYYVPYYVVGHTVFTPTLNYDNIINDGDHVNYVDLEVLFVYHGWNRYATIHIATVNASILTVLYDSFAPMGTEVDAEEFMKSFGVKECDEGDPNIRYTFDFYNEIGEMQEVGFSSPVDICDCIVSARLIGLRWEDRDADK